MPHERTNDQIDSRHITRTLVASVGLIASLSACSASKSPRPLPHAPIKLTPNMTNFLEPGSKTTCYNGGARPCALQLRTKPTIAAPKINVNQQQPAQRINWPVEAYNGKPGDKLVVVCYTTGQTIGPLSNADSVASSNKWYTVLVQANEIHNPAVQHEFEGNSARLDTEKYAGQRMLLGYASVEWFDQQTADTKIPPCPGN